MGYGRNTRKAGRRTATRQTSLGAATVIEDMRDIMPSKNSGDPRIPHARHLLWPRPRAIFRVARELYERVSVPARFLAPDANRLLSPDEIEREFLGANPWLKPDMISISCRGANLLDIRVCFGRDLSPRNAGSTRIRGGSARRIDHRTAAGAAMTGRRA